MSNSLPVYPRICVSASPPPSHCLSPSFLSLLLPLSLSLIISCEVRGVCALPLSPYFPFPLSFVVCTHRVWRCVRVSPFWSSVVGALNPSSSPSPASFHKHTHAHIHARTHAHTHTFVHRVIYPNCAVPCLKLWTRHYSQSKYQVYNTFTKQGGIYTTI